MNMIVTNTDIAAAMGISRVAVHKKAKKQQWQPTGKRVQGGGVTYEIDSLPLKAVAKNRLRSRLLAKASKLISQQAAIDALEDEKHEIEQKIKALKQRGKAKGKQ